MKFAIVFPGQGSQYVGMGKEYYENYSIAREIFEQANKVLGFDLKELCFNGELEELSLTQNAQPAILTVSYIAFKVFMEKHQIVPKYFVGHSLGEYTALVCAGAIDFKHAVKIVYQRGIYMQEVMNDNIGKMLAINGKNIDYDFISKECSRVKEGIVVISNYNSLGQIVISGHENAVDIINKTLKNNGYNTAFLNVSAAFHSPLMNDAAQNLEKILLQYTFKELNTPILSNVTALPYIYNDDIIYKLVKHMTNPVMWVNSMEYLNNQDIEFLVECGPNKVLKKLMKEIFPKIDVYSYDENDDVKKLELVIDSTLKIRKQNFITKCISIAICSKNYNCLDGKYEKGFVVPYRAIKKFEKEMRDKDSEPLLSDMKKAVNMLESTFKIKHTRNEEQLMRFKQLFEETGLRRLFSEEDLPEILRRYI